MARQVTARTRLRDVRIRDICELEGIPVAQAVEIVQRLVDDRVFHWAHWAEDTVVLLPHGADGSVLH